MKSDYGILSGNDRNTIPKNVSFSSTRPHWTIFDSGC